MHIRSIVVMMVLPLVFCAIELAGAPVGNFATLLARWAPALIAVAMAATVIAADRRRRLGRVLGSAGSGAHPARRADRGGPTESEQPRPDCRTA